MPRLAFRLGTLGICLMIACGDDSTDPVVAPADWIAVESSCGFTFHAPPEVEQQPAQPIDSCAELYATDTCEYGAGSGGYATSYSDLTSSPDFRYMEIRIDGSDAELRSATVASDGETFLYAAVDFGPDGDGIYTTMDARCREAGGLDEADVVFRSIRRTR
jgi:hypothetical protein